LYTKFDDVLNLNLQKKIWQIDNFFS
jgi:hypothetical protein